MENIIQAAELALLFPTKTPTPTTTYITPLLILSTAKMIFPTPSSCVFDVFAPPSSITRQEALEKCVRETEGRIPLVLIYHPLTSRVKHILLNNFNILTTDPVTATIFPAPPVVAHRRDLSLRDVLVHTSDRNQTEELGTVFA